jgi:uncharacterized protein
VNDDSSTAAAGVVRFGDQWQDGFWDAVDRGEIAVQRCANGHHQFPGGPSCARCGEAVRWEAVGGEGEVWSWAVFHHNYFAEFATQLPYAVLIVALDEGPRIYAGVHPIEQATPRIGVRVRLEVADYPFRPVPLARFLP